MRRSSWRVLVAGAVAVGAALALQVPSAQAEPTAGPCMSFGWCFGAPPH